MTSDHSPLTRAELASLLTDAAHRVSAILTADYPTAAGRSYLHPVLGALSAGPQVICELNDRLEEFVANDPLPRRRQVSSPWPPTPPPWDGSPSPWPS
ncbi:hypothetical protein [Streptomyces sp. NPDC007007]|uniref:hypothetical protein n=1 Tax=Streptomyces sp. NPDC007007 TaxID=3364770 RepID=UPI0036CEEE2F